jgi:hypothetical protein
LKISQIFDSFEQMTFAQKNALKRAQLLGAQWNREQKLLRLDQADMDVKQWLDQYFSHDNSLIFFLSGLYLGEGRKSDDTVLFANSNPEIVSAFLKIFRSYFQTDTKKFRAYLHLRSDQNIEKVKRFWSKTTNIPETLFRKTQVDKRTQNKQTHAGYMGVCAIYYHDAKIQRYLLAFQKQCIQKIIGF